MSFGIASANTPRDCSRSLWFLSRISKNLEFKSALLARHDSWKFPWFERKLSFMVSIQHCSLTWNYFSASYSNPNECPDQGVWQDLLTFALDGWEKNWHFLKPNAKDALKSVVEVVGEGCPFLTMGLSRPQLKLAPERTTQMGMRVWDLRAKWCQKPWEWVADKGW